MSDSIPIHMKLGYDHMLEMASIRARLGSSGLTGKELHFAAVREYETTHAGDPTYRERQQARPRAKIPADALREALRAIRDGHNDPRALAREVLSALSMSDDPE